MPRYSTHLIFNLSVLAALFILYQLNPVLSIPQLTLFLFGFVTGTVIVTPDLDTHSEATRRCGVLCKPYQIASKHRALSHHWLWGIVLRILYFIIVIALILWVLGLIQQAGALIPTAVNNSDLIIAAVAGLFISNILHITLDRIT